MRIWNKLSLVAVLALAAAALPAAEYHVAVTGNDAAAGTAQAPWKTVQHAVNKAKSGDTILLHGGTYRESVVIKTEGQEPLKLKAAPGEKPVLAGSEAVGPWEDLGDGLFSAELPGNLTNVGYLFVDGKLARAEYSSRPVKVGGFSYDIYGPAWDNPPVKMETNPAAGEVAAGDVKWRKVDAPNGMLDISALSPKEAPDAFFVAFAYVYCPVKWEVMFGDTYDYNPKLKNLCGYLNSDDPANKLCQPLELWVNGKRIEYFEPQHGWARRFDFKPGWNTVAVKMTNAGEGPWYLNGATRLAKNKGKATLVAQTDRPTSDAAPAEGAPSTLKSVPTAMKNNVPHITQWLVAGPFPSVPTHKVYLRLAKGDTPDKHVTEWATRPRVLSAEKSAAPVHVEGLSLSYGANKAQDAMVSLQSPKSMVTDCDVSCSTGRGIQLGHEGIIQNNRVSYHGCVGIGGSKIRNLQVLDNVVTNNNWRNFVTSWECGGMKLLKTENAIARGNRVEDNNGWGIWFDWECHGTLIENNFCRNNMCAGIFLEASRTPNTIINNICIGTRAQNNWGDGIYMHDTSDALIANNLCLDNATFGIRVQLATDRIWQADNKLVACVDNRVLNNVCAGNKLGSIMVPLDANDRQKGNVSDCNLMAPLPNGTVAQPSLRDLSDKELMGMYGPEGSALSKAPQSNFATWQKLGFDKNGKVGVPTFVNAAKDDFRPAPGSPAIGMCNALPEVPLDAAGAKRSAKTTAGPFEASTTTQPAK